MRACGDRDLDASSSLKTNYLIQLDHKDKVKIVKHTVTTRFLGFFVELTHNMSALFGSSQKKNERVADELWSWRILLSLGNSLFRTWSEWMYISRESSHDISDKASIIVLSVIINSAFTFLFRSPIVLLFVDSYSSHFSKIRKILRKIFDDFHRRAWSHSCFLKNFLCSDSSRLAKWFIDRSQWRWVAGEMKFLRQLFFSFN